MNTAQEVTMNEEVDQDKWRKINCTFKRIMSQTPENEGTLIVVDFKARTYEVVDSNVVVTDFKAPRKRNKRK